MKLFTSYLIFDRFLFCFSLEIGGIVIGYLSIVTFSILCGLIAAFALLPMVKQIFLEPSDKDDYDGMWYQPRNS